MARQKTAKTRIVEDIMALAVELSADRMTATRRKEISAELVIIANRVKRLRCR